MSARIFLAEEPKLCDDVDWEEPYLLPRLGDGCDLGGVPAEAPTGGGI